MEPRKLDDPDDPGAVWMLELQRGDESAFERILQTYQHVVHGIAYRYTGRREGVEDLAQEVFLRIYRARTRYRPEAKFRTWLFRIVINLCINETKSRRLRRAASLDADLSAGDGELRLRDLVADASTEAPSAPVERAEVARRLREALAELAPNQRSAMTLYQYRELSLAEIAEILGTTDKAVKSLLARARESLRDKLGPYLRRAGEPIPSPGGRA
ncbi:MAG TPA: sigma-70 family RNA polymerase sigma factor [Planctomycetota bacterium]|nr:sigma-70 family RNA polymerase sigma factor [Planctomycetota bacterium]